MATFVLLTDLANPPSKTMKVSYAWLQKYFAEQLPSPREVADALTFHAFEIEEQEGDMLDVKVLADRAPYGLSHRGVALEVGAALDRELVEDPLRTPLPAWHTTQKLFVEVDDATACPRYMGALVEGVTVGPSPAWLRSTLESVGQRSINNVVDATNYVMLNLGQPLHAFDARKLASPEGSYGIRVRESEAGEHITLLGGTDVSLPQGILLITDAYTHTPLGVAGVKGGTHAEVDATTTTVLIEAANFAGPRIRKAAQELKLWTDASQRFQNSLSPQLAAYGMRDVLALIADIAGGTVVGVVDNTSDTLTERLAPIAVTLEKIQSVLGFAIESDEVAAALTRLGTTFIESEGVFVVTPSFERRDLSIPEDVIEEIGRTIGYDRVPATPLPLSVVPGDQSRYYGIEAIKDVLLREGFTELSTQSFAMTGDIKLANPLQADRPWLRRTLIPNMEDALARAEQHAPRTLGPVQEVKLFEIGSVFTSGGEHLALSIGVRVLTGKKSRAAELVRATATMLATDVLGVDVAAHYAEDGMAAELSLASVDLARLGFRAPHLAPFGSFVPFSIYPAALRDVAVWTPAGTDEAQVHGIVLASAGPLLVRADLFDRFEKEGRVSYAFRLVFESMERTLTDADLDPAMAQVTAALLAHPGFEVR